LIIYFALPVGVSHAHARALVRSKIESILGSHHTLSELSLGNDILLTRCSEDKVNLFIYLQNDSSDNVGCIIWLYIY